MDNAVNKYLKNDSSIRVVLNVEEFEIALTLAKILNEDARTFAEQRPHNPIVQDIGRKFGLGQENSSRGKSLN